MVARVGAAASGGYPEEGRRRASSVGGPATRSQREARSGQRDGANPARTSFGELFVVSRVRFRVPWWRVRWASDGSRAQRPQAQAAGPGVGRGQKGRGRKPLPLPPRATGERRVRAKCWRRIACAARGTAGRARLPRPRRGDPRRSTVLGAALARQPPSFSPPASKGEERPPPPGTLTARKNARRGVLAGVAALRTHATRERRSEKAPFGRAGSATECVLRGEGDRPLCGHYRPARRLAKHLQYVWRPFERLARSKPAQRRRGPAFSLEGGLGRAKLRAVERGGAGRNQGFAENALRARSGAHDCRNREESGSTGVGLVLGRRGAKRWRPRSPASRETGPLRYRPSSSRDPQLCQESFGAGAAPRRIPPSALEHPSPLLGAPPHPAAPVGVQEAGGPRGRGTAPKPGRAPDARRRSRDAPATGRVEPLLACG